MIVCIGLSSHSIWSPLIGEDGLLNVIAIVFLQVTPLIVISTQKLVATEGEIIMDSETSPVDQK